MSIIALKSFAADFFAQPFNALMTSGGVFLAAVTGEPSGEQLHWWTIVSGVCFAITSIMVTTYWCDREGEVLEYHVKRVLSFIPGLARLRPKHHPRRVQVETPPGADDFRP